MGASISGNYIPISISFSGGGVDDLFLEPLLESLLLF